MGRRLRTTACEGIAQRREKERAKRDGRGLPPSSSPTARLETGTLLRQAHREPARRQAAYRLESRRMLSHGVDPAVAERLRNAVSLGSADFAERMRRLTRKRD